MTFQEAWAKYWELKEAALLSRDSTRLDEFVAELAQLASGLPIVPADLSEEVFREIRAK